MLTISAGFHTQSSPQSNHTQTICYIIFLGQPLYHSHCLNEIYPGQIQRGEERGENNLLPIHTVLAEINKM